MKNSLYLQDTHTNNLNTLNQNPLPSKSERVTQPLNCLSISIKVSQQGYQKGNAKAAPPTPPKNASHADRRSRSRGPKIHFVRGKQHQPSYPAQPSPTLPNPIQNINHVAMQCQNMLQAEPLELTTIQTKKKKAAVATRREP